MFEVIRFGKVLGKVLGSRDAEKTKAAAVQRFGKGVTLRRAI